jgi:hypothetical protein
LGKRLVVKRTFLQVEAADAEDDKSLSARRGSRRAFTEPCKDHSEEYDLTPELSDDEVEIEQAKQPLAIRCGEAEGNPMTFLKTLQTSLFTQVASSTERKTNNDDIVLSGAGGADVKATPEDSISKTMQNSMVSFETRPSTTHTNLQQQDHSQPVDCEGKPRNRSRTTVMLRNIPNNYTRDMFTELLDAHGFSGRYNFVYLPMDFRRGSGLGYAFVNCVSTSDAQQMMQRFQGFQEWHTWSQKVCEVCFGVGASGIQQLIRRYRNSPVMHHTVPDEWKPIILMDGVHRPFPAPTRKICAPQNSSW